MTRPISALDVPLPEVERQIAEQRLATSVDKLRWLLAEQTHQLDPADTAFAALACEHPEACSCPEDYPNWTPGRTS